jgi:hypothetical protein
MDVTKREAACRQLATAIWLYFEDIDPMSVHTLANAAGEIIDGLLKQQGFPSGRDESLGLIVPERRDEIGRLLNRGRNFLKHHSQPDSVLEGFGDEWNTLPIWVGCAGLRRLYGADVPLEVGVWEGWLSVVEPDLLSVPATQEASGALGNTMRHAPRSAQKAWGRDLLVEVSGRADRWRHAGASETGDAP